MCAIITRFVVTFAVILTTVEADGFDPTAVAFRKSKIVPDIVPSPPQSQLTASFSTGVTVQLGNALSPSQVGPAQWRS